MILGDFRRLHSGPPVPVDELDAGQIKCVSKHSDRPRPEARRSRTVAVPQYFRGEDEIEAFRVEDDSAPTQTGSVIYCPLEAMDIERRTP